jgi:hypothetical protein
MALAGSGTKVALYGRQICSKKFPRLRKMVTLGIVAATMVAHGLKK